MRKPLLTDEIVAKAQEEQSKPFGYYDGKEDVYQTDDELARTPVYGFEEDYQGYEEGQTIRIPVEQSIVKSRRIETVKKAEFGAKVNKILFLVIFLLVLLVLAVFYF